MRHFVEATKAAYPDLDKVCDRYLERSRIGVWHKWRQVAAKDNTEEVSEELELPVRTRLSTDATSCRRTMPNI